MKKVVFTLFNISLFSLMPLMVLAQNTFTRTQKFANPQWELPSFTGIHDSPIIGLSYRQNINQNGNGLSSYELGFSTPINRNYDGSVDNSGFTLSSEALQKKLKNNREGRRKHGLGANIRTLRYENYQRNEFQISYAYHLPISNSYNMSFGANIIYGMTGLNTDNLTVRDPENDILYQKIMQEGGLSRNDLKSNVGFSFYSDDLFITATLRQIIFFENNNVGEESSTYPFQPEFSVSYIWRAFNKFNIIPSVSYSMQAPFEPSLTSNLRINYYEFISLGFGIQSNTRYSALFGIKLSRDIFLNYAFDSYQNYGAKLSNGVHELSFSYLFNNKRAKHPVLW